MKTFSVQYIYAWLKAVHSSALSVHKRNRFHKVSQYEREEYNMFSKSKAWNINYYCLPTRFQFLVSPTDVAKRFGSEWRVWILAGRFLFKRPPIRQKFERFCSKWNFTKWKESQNKTATGGNIFTVKTVLHEIINGCLKYFTSTLCSSFILWGVGSGGKYFRGWDLQLVRIANDLRPN